jgi:hypothetical protein
MDQSILHCSRVWRILALSSLWLLLICNPGWSLDVTPSNAPSNPGRRTVQGSPDTANGGLPLDLDGLLDDAPKNDRLFHVGRLPRPAVAKDLPPGAAAVEGLNQDERLSSDWIELEIDKDGTYLFFGDVDDAGPTLLGPPEEHMMPGGIGLSKKWRF